MKVTRTRKTGIYRKIYERVRCVPHGRVTTYGEIARMVGCSARQVGYAMAATPRDEGIPWQRVVNRLGRISVRNSGHPDLRQQLILEEEGVDFSSSGKIDLERFGWNGEISFELTSSEPSRKHNPCNPLI